MLDITNLPYCTVGIVIYNGKEYLGKLLESINALAYPKEKLEIIVVDNGSRDGSVDFVRNFHPDIKILFNINNFSRALNLVIDHSTGDYVAFLNTDMEVHPAWLTELISVFTLDEKVACVGSKILFEDKKTINSVGHQHIGAFYFSDKGFMEMDNGQYDHQCEADGICGGSVAWRKSAIKEIGGYDEDFLMYFEDVEVAHRCKKAGYNIKYTHKSIVYHKFHGSGNDELAYFLCNRNRLLFLAAHMPTEVPAALLSSHLVRDNKYQLMCDILPSVINKLVLCNSDIVVNDVILQLKRVIFDIISPHDIQRVISKYRYNHAKVKLSMCIYPPPLDLPGDSRAVVEAIIDILDATFDITWLSDASIRQPYKDPVDTISERTAAFDIFFNAGVGVVNPLSTYSVLLWQQTNVGENAHFPLTNYDLLVVGSDAVFSTIADPWGNAGKVVIIPFRDHPSLLRKKVIEMMEDIIARIFLDRTNEMRYYLDACKVH